MDVTKEFGEKMNVTLMEAGTGSHHELVLVNVKVNQFGIIYESDKELKTFVPWWRVIEIYEV